MKHTRTIIMITLAVALAMTSGCALDTDADEAEAISLAASAEFESLGSIEGTSDVSDGDVVRPLPEDEDEYVLGAAGNVAPATLAAADDAWRNRGSASRSDSLRRAPLKRLDPPSTAVPYSDDVDVAPWGEDPATEVVQGESYGDYSFLATPAGEPNSYFFTARVNGIEYWDDDDTVELGGTGLVLEQTANCGAVLSGTLSAAGDFEIMIVATQASGNFVGQSGSYTFTLTVDSVDADEPDDDEGDAEGSCDVPVIARVIGVGGWNICDEEGETDCIDIAEDGVPFTLGEKGSVEIEITGGRKPYMITVSSRVEDSFHKYNVGHGSLGVHMGHGITNFKYWNSDKYCLTTEEYEDIYGMDDEVDFWPDCSNPDHLPVDKKNLCDAIGCGHSDWWHDDLPNMLHHGVPIEEGTELYEHALHCVNGFGQCPPPEVWHLLPDYHKTACEKYLEWKHSPPNSYSGLAEYVCKWTKDPTWRHEDVDYPSSPAELWQWENLHGEPWSAPKFHMTTDNVVTFVTNNEVNGPLPVNKGKYKTDGMQDFRKPPVERVLFTVSDSCSGKGHVAVAPLKVKVDYPRPLKVSKYNLNVDYKDYNRLKGGLPKDMFDLDFLFIEDKSEADEGDTWGDALDYASGEVHFNIYDWAENHGSHETDVEAINGDGDVLMEDIDWIFVSIFAGYQKETGSGFIMNDPYVSWGDFDLKKISLRSRYDKATFYDEDVGNMIDSNVNGFSPGTYTIRMDDFRSRAMVREDVYTPFVRRDLIPGPFTY